MSVTIKDNPMDTAKVIAEAESIINQRRREAAERVGVDESKVQTHRLELRKLREAGLLIDLDIHGVSMFSVRTTYAELGISAEDVRSKRLRAGTKDLFPEYSKKLRSLEGRARQNLARHSHVIPAFGQYRWLPWTAYEKYSDKHAEILAELDATKAELLCKYDDLREENRVYFEQVALRAWRDLRAGFADPDSGMIVTTDQTEFGPGEEPKFVEYVVQKALGRMPLPDEIRDGVRIDYKTSILYSEAEIAADQAALEQAEAEYAQARLQHAQTEQAVFDVHLQEREAESQSQARIAAYRRAELEHARQQLAEMGSPIQDALDGLRANLYDAVHTLLAGLRKNTTFRGKAGQKAADLYAYWQKLNGGLLQDADLERALAALDGQMTSYQVADKNARQAQIGDIEAQLAEIAALTAESARKIRSESGSRASVLEL